MTAVPRGDLNSLQHALTERERRAAAAVHQLREQIAILTTHLTHAEAGLAGLATTRRTLTALAGPSAEGDPAPEPGSAGPAEATASSGTTAGTDASPGAEATVPGSPGYTQILAAFGDPGTSMRAKDLCLLPGLAPIPKNTEGLRAKLKRLAARGALHEPSPGLFTLAPPPDPA